MQGTYLKKRNITEEKTLQKSSYDKIEAKTLQCVMNGSCHGSNFLWPLILKLSFDEPLMYSCCVLCVIVKVQHGGISRPSRGLSLFSLPPPT